jgi:hypothetical protein
MSSVVMTKKNGAKRAIDAAIPRDRYTAGKCNIGENEIAMRLRAGWFGLALTIILWGIFIVASVQAPWRLTLFFPATLSAMGFLQAHNRFCVYFGFASIFNFGTVGNKISVLSESDKTLDRRHAKRIISIGVLFGIVIAMVGYLLAI